jgi:hypothetical protein
MTRLLTASWCGGEEASFAGGAGGGALRSHDAAFVVCFNPLNAELNPICHLLALLGGATIVVVSRLRVT